MLSSGRMKMFVPRDKLATIHIKTGRAIPTKTGRAKKLRILPRRPLNSEAKVQAREDEAKIVELRLRSRPATLPRGPIASTLRMTRCGRNVSHTSQVKLQTGED